MPWTHRWSAMFIVAACLSIAAPDARTQPRLVGPVLQIQTTPLEFDTVRCGTQKCLQLTLRNIGDGPMNVGASALAAPPFTGSIAAATVPPGTSRMYQFCYTAAATASVDSQRVTFRADSRLPVSLGLVTDVSASMSSAFGSTTRILAAQAASDSLFNDLLFTPAIRDEAAVYSAGAATTLLQDFTSTRATLTAALPGTAGGADACLYDALLRAVNDTRARNGVPVVVLITGGQNTCAGSPTQIAAVIAAAQAAPEPVRIYTIDMGQTAVAELQQLATQTGGMYQSATDPAGLTAALRAIATMLSINTSFDVLLRARTVAPQITLSPAECDFGAVLVGSSRCQTVAVQNTGNAPLDISSVTVPAPFVIQSAPASPVPPGGSANMTVCYAPAALGFVQAQGRLTNSSCNEPSLQFAVRGVGMPTSNAVLGPILQIVPSPVDFDTTLCATTKCLTVTFANVGDTALTVRNVPAPPPPFSGLIPTPFNLTPGQSRSFQVCYQPPDAPRVDSAVVTLNADTRVSMSIGMLFDVSGSMTLAISGADATQRIAAARSAGMDFVSSLIDTLGVRDEAAVMTFSNTFAVPQTFTTDKTALTSTIAGLTANGGTRLYSSLVDAITTLAVRGNRKVLIVLTDGEDNLSTHTPAQVIAAAQAAGITIFTIGIGEANATILTNMASTTGGRFFSASTTTDLVGVYRQIAALLGQNSTTTYRLRGRGIRPVIQVVPTVQFDSTMVGDTRCIDILVGNTGEAPLRVTGVAIGNPPFSFDTPVPFAVLPGATASVRVCFSPTRLRLLRDTVTFIYQGCGQERRDVLLEGIGYDSVAVWLQGAYTAKPGSSVRFPIRLTRRIPAEYDVSSYTLRLRYNKTLLAGMRPSGMQPSVPAHTAGTLSSGLIVAAAAETANFAEADATLRLDVSGLLTNPVDDSVLIMADLLALLGNSRTTDVSILSAQFADGNPRAGIFSPAVFRIDSLCYLDARLLETRGRVGMLKEGRPNPFTETTRIPFVLAAACRARLSVLDAYGRELRVLHDAWTEEGEYTATFEAAGLPAGLYFARLTCDGQPDTQKLLLVR